MIQMPEYKYIYGPVNSWRLGRSLGIDPISSGNKVCTFDCIYCQVGKARPSPPQRRVFVPTKEFIREFKSFPKVKVDYITFSGTGEPTIAKNLGNMIQAVRGLSSSKIAVITNSTMLGRKDVQRELESIDLVEAKLDAPSNTLLRIINKPYGATSVKRIVNSIKRFRNIFKGKFILQIMFTKESIVYAEELAKIARYIQPDGVDLNTPLRPCGIKPVSKKDIEKIRPYFKGLNVISVYDKRKKQKIKSISKKDTLKRRGKV